MHILEPEYCSNRVFLRYAVAAMMIVVVSASSCTNETVKDPQRVDGVDKIEDQKPAGDRGKTSSSYDYELLTILGDARLPDKVRNGRWREARKPAPETTLEISETELMELRALPYLQGYRQAPEAKEVTIYDSKRAYDGVNLLNSGHEPSAFLMDLQGNVVHTWKYALEDVWPDVPHTVHGTFWRRTWAFANGDLLAIFEGVGLIKLDRESRFLWGYRGGCHHEVFVTGDDKIYVLTRRAQMLKEVNPEEPVVPDAVVVLSANGEVLEEVSILECLRNSSFEHLLAGMPKRGDLLHTNSIYAFSEEQEQLSPYFRRGNVLISIFKLDTLAILDLEERAVVWAKSGVEGRLWRRQHDPQILPNGNILLFDNRGNGGKSKVLEYDIERDQIVWQFAGSEGDELFSDTCGTSAMLPNGNILITESDNGRALEVTREKEVVWEYYNPHRAGKDGRLIATLFEVQRFDWDYFPWLQRHSDLVGLH